MISIQSIPWLPLINGAVFTDLLFTNMLLSGVFESATLREWYRQFTAIAVMQDVFILIIGVILTYFFYPMVFSTFSIGLFVGLAVVIQLIHDIGFGYFISSVPKGTNKIFDLFKRYSNEHGGGILVADTLMMISTIFSMKGFSLLSRSTNYILLIVLIYIYPYFLYSI
jgi:hypothetical protein